MIDAVARMLSGCLDARAVMPPTALFCEGWMLRLVLDQLDRNRDVEHVLGFAPGARWYSEALLASRFLASCRGDVRAEGYTHADGIVGHFTVSPARGEAVLSPDAQQFIVLEAKMGSPLSAGTKNAPAFDQAARNVACIAQVLNSAGVEPTSVGKLGFYVIAPLAQIHCGAFGSLVTKPSIEVKVRQRIAAYAGTFDSWFEDIFLPTLDHIDLGIIAWEDILMALPQNAETDELKEFYAQCLQFIPLQKRTDAAWS